MPLPDVNQIVDPESVRRVVTDRVEANTVVREFFNDIPGGLPAGAGSSYEIPVPAEELGEPEEVEPGADTTYDREEYGRPVVERQIFKKGSKIPEEDVNDNLFDLVADHMEGHSKNMAKTLDRKAFDVLDAAAPAAEAVSESGGADGSLSFADINAGITELANRGDDGFSADTALVDTAGRESITNWLAERGTQLGDETVRNGEIGTFGGIRYLTTSNVSFSGTNPQALLIDSEHFGYEAEWQAPSTSQTTDFDSDSVKIKVKSAYGWVPKFEEAAVRVEG